MLFKGNSSKLELLIEKIQANKETTGEIQFDSGCSLCEYDDDGDGYDFKCEHGGLSVWK